MGRTIRQVKEAVLSVTEGSRDASFQKHLKKLYHCIEKDVTIKDVHGGDPSQVVHHTIAVSEHYSYGACHATFDMDRGEDDVNAAQENADKHDIRVHKSDTNVEVELLRLLDGGNSKMLKKAMTNAHEAKKILQEYCRLRKIDDVIDWERFFPQALLDEKRESSDWLDGQIKIFER